MSAKCSGINYSLQLHPAGVEVHPRLFQQGSRTLGISEIESVELLRKSVMPPAMIGLVGLLVTLILRLPDGWLIGNIALELSAYLQLVTLGLAVVCLILLVVRWFFANLVLKPANMSAISVKMVPSGSARRFVTLFQMQTRIPNGLDREVSY